MKTSLYMSYDDTAMQMFFREMRKYFPELNAKLLGYIGFRGKSSLRTKFLMGQELNLTKTRDRLGRPTIEYYVGKQGKYVRIASYPVNLFERGRNLRGGKRERGRHIIKTKFKNYMTSNLQRYASEFDVKYLKNDLNNMDYQNYKPK
jgi:hypothetical protein